jgi:hypothetical protein
MKNFETLEGDFVVGRRCPLIHTALGPGIPIRKPEIAHIHIPVESSTFRFHVPFAIAFWLKRLSYLRYALQAASDRTGLDEQADDLRLNPQERSLLEPFVPRSVAA